MAYGRVEETFWHDGKIRALSEDGRHLYLYLLTGPHRNRLGCYVLDIQYAAADIQWRVDRVDKALAELVRIDRVAWDPENRMILVKRFLKYNTMENTNVVKGAKSDLKALPDTPLFEMLIEALIKYSKAHYSLVITALRNRLPNDYPNGIANPGLLEPSPEPSLSLPEPSLSRASAHEPRSDDEKAFLDWLGETHREVLERYIRELDAPTATVGSIWKAYCPAGLDGAFAMQGELYLERLGGEDQRKAMAATLESQIGEKRKYQQNVFRAVLRDNANLFKEGHQGPRRGNVNLDTDEFNRAMDAAMIEQTGTVPGRDL